MPINFYDQPIINSPCEHWGLDGDRLLTNNIVERRRRTSGGQQPEMVFDEGNDHAWRRLAPRQSR